MILTKTKIGPQHHGRKMSLRAFDFAPIEDGWLYELARGYVVVSEVPGLAHLRCVAVLRGHLDHYWIEDPRRIFAVCASMDCKILIPDWESERHPDIAVYLTAPKNRKDKRMWRTWVPDLAIEVVSESSRDRDYTEKRDEYWAVGVKEYWIVDAKLQRVVILKRGRSQWTEKTLGPADVCETKLLPEFTLPCRTIFEVSEDGDE
jgi:Uma2 family endonuclease